MGLSLGRIGENAAKAEALEQQIARGEVVQDLDPNLIEPSFVEDRLARTADPDFRRLVDSIGTAGQQAPILVRPHPERAGRYQVAYGHRRLSACVELAQKVKAIVRPLTDTQLVVAQGKENAERRNLSFIERAQFAAHLEQKGFRTPCPSGGPGSASRGTDPLARGGTQHSGPRHRCNRPVASCRTAPMDGICYLTRRRRRQRTHSYDRRPGVLPTTKLRRTFRTSHRKASLEAT